MRPRDAGNSAALKLILVIAAFLGFAYGSIDAFFGILLVLFLVACSFRIFR